MNIEDVPAEPSVGVRQWEEKGECLYVKKFFLS